MDKLPQELIDKIISSLDHTRPSGYSALLECSLVSRSWLRQARKGLFSSIRLDAARLKEWVRDIPLENEIPSYIRYLAWAIRPTTTERPDPFLETTFPGRFVSFSNIEFLYLPKLSLSSLDIIGIERIFGHISHSLRRLNIPQLETDPEKLCSFVSLLPNLRYMYTPFVTMVEGEGGSGPNSPPSFNFAGHIGPYSPTTDQFFRCIAGLRPRFETLEARIINDELIDTFNLVVQSCSATLTTVLISPPLYGTTAAIDEILPLDLSSCRNLHALRVDPEMANHPQFDAFLQTISSKHFEKLIIAGRDSSPHWGVGTNDGVLHSFAERLHKLGARKPLTMELEYSTAEGVVGGTPDVQLIWPLFCEVGVIVKNYNGGRRWGHDTRDPFQGGSVAISIFYVTQRLTGTRS